MLSETQSQNIDAAIERLWRESGLTASAATVTPLSQIVDANYNIRFFEEDALTFGKAAHILQREIGREIEVARGVSPRLAGFLYAESLDAFLFVQRDDPIVRRRFSVAHELGHYLLHRSADEAIFCEGFSFVDGAGDEAQTTQSELLHDAQTPLDIEQLEREANAFAARLLMPSEVCRRLWQENMARFGQRAELLTRRLATDLLVSQSALEIRLRELELRAPKIMNPARRFAADYGGCRIQHYVALPPMWSQAAHSIAATPDDETSTVDLEWEQSADKWRAIAPDLPPNWRVDEWPARPIRFVDGTDKGDTIVWFRAPAGYPVPLRFSQLGAVVIEIENGVKNRVFDFCEPVVSLVADAFPWHAVESFADDLSKIGIRMLVAKPPQGNFSYDFETMRNAAMNRSRDEMGVYEEAAIAQDNSVSTVIDGILEPRSGGFDARESPVVGVVKTHRQTYLHPLGLQLLYTLDVGERTPMFSIHSARKADGALTERKLPVVSWYLRLAGGGGSLPSWGFVRVEVTKSWLENNHPDLASQTHFADCLSRALFAYRCTDQGYGRAAVSLDPIVRAEDHMKALLMPQSVLLNQFYNLTGL